MQQATRDFNHLLARVAPAAFATRPQSPSIPTFSAVTRYEPAASADIAHSKPQAFTPLPQEHTLVPPAHTPGPQAHALISLVSIMRTPDRPAINAVSRHLVSFCPDPALTAESLAERAMYLPTQTATPTFDTSKVEWDAMLPQLQAVCRTIAVTKGGCTKSTRAEDMLMQLMTKYNVLGTNTALLAQAPLTPPPHLANKRMMLAFFDNNDAATSVTTCGKDGQPQLRKRI